MHCLTKEKMDYFLQLTGLDVEIINEFMLKVLSEIPVLYVWNGVTFCADSGVML